MFFHCLCLPHEIMRLRRTWFSWCWHRWWYPKTWPVPKALGVVEIFSCLVVTGTMEFLWLSIKSWEWNFIIPTDEVILFRGVENTNQILYEIYIILYNIYIIYIYIYLFIYVYIYMWVYHILYILVRWLGLWILRKATRSWSSWCLFSNQLWINCRWSSRRRGPS